GPGRRPAPLRLSRSFTGPLLASYFPVIPENHPMGRPQLSRRPRRAWADRTFKPRPILEILEDRVLPSNGQWLAVFEGISPGNTLEEQAQYGQNLLSFAGVADQDVHVLNALDLSGSFLVQAPLDVNEPTLTAELQGV